MTTDISQAPSIQPALSTVVGRKGVIAVVEVAEPTIAAKLAGVLAEGGVAGLEITLRTPRALEAIAAAAETYSLPVGAGTVLDASQAAAALDAGAEFLVSPGVDEALLRALSWSDVPLVPGVLTPSEIQIALRLGFREMKLFPAERFGGLDLIRSLSPAFRQVSFVPTGGINLTLAADYLRHDQVIAVGGTWMAPADLLAKGDWVEIARRATAVGKLSAAFQG